MKKKAPRNKDATKAWLRGGAGPMKDRRAPRGGSSNLTKEQLKDYIYDLEDSMWELTDSTSALLASIRQFKDRINEE